MLDEIIKSFCGTEELSPAQRNPIRDDDNIVATNAHMLIVAPKRYFNKKYGENDKFPKYKAIIPEHNPAEIVFTINNKQVLDYVNGLETVPIYADCKYCNGTGDEMCSECRHSHDCDMCRGSGHGAIIGRDIKDYSYSAIIYGTYMQVKLLAAICRVSELVGEPARFCLIQNEKPCLAYIADIMILIMPLMKPYDNVLPLAA